MPNIYAARIRCYEDTQARALALPPPPASVKLADLGPLAPPHGEEPLDCVVENMDSLECGVKHLREGHNPVVLNLADDYWPGGCVDTGSGAQEESLFRCTNLCATLSHASRMYPIQDDQLIYSPGVAVLKSSEATGWRVLDPPLDKLAFISCPGLRFPQLLDGRLRPEDEERLRVKVRLILRCAALKGHDVVVMGALGCGAWRNPAPHVAEVFSGVLGEPEFRGRFAQVVFAILKPVADMYIIKPDRTLRDNFDVFAEVFRAAL